MFVCVYVGVKFNILCYDRLFGFLFCHDNYFYCGTFIAPFFVIFVMIVAFSNCSLKEYKKVSHNQPVTAGEVKNRYAADYVFLSTVMFFVFSAITFAIVALVPMLQLESLKVVVMFSNKSFCCSVSWLSLLLQNPTKRN